MTDTAGVQELIRFERFIDAVKHSLERHSVTLLIWDFGLDRPVGMGSATCIELRGFRYLLTAAHVVQDEQGQQVDPRTIKLIYRQDHTPINEFVRRVLAVGGRPGDSLDIALLELSEEGADEIATSKDFVPETRVLRGVSADESSRFAVCGAPLSWSQKSLVHKTFDAGKMCYVTISCDPFPSDLDQSHDIALEYNKTSNISPSQDGMVEAPDPRGLSGGGIWLISEAQEGAFWDPSESKLIGVQHSWQPRSEFVRGTQVQFAISLLN